MLQVKQIFPKQSGEKWHFKQKQHHVQGIKVFKSLADPWEENMLDILLEKWKTWIVLGGRGRVDIGLKMLPRIRFLRLNLILQVGEGL